jgi:hypothetical protein
MSIVTLRPDGRANYGGTWYNDGSYGPDPYYWKVNDANDGTYIYDVSDGSYAEFYLSGYALAENERCWHARIYTRLRGNSSSFQFNADNWLRAPWGDGGGVNVNGVVSGLTTFVGGWFANSANEVYQYDIDNLMVVIRDNGGVTRPWWVDVWAEIEILHRPEVSAISYNTNVRNPLALWTFYDPDGRLGQKSWQVHVRRADNFDLSYDSGEVYNGAQSQQLPAFGNGSYQLIVRVTDDNWGYWSSNWTYKSGGMTINAAPYIPTNLQRTGGVLDNTPNFSVDIAGYAGYAVQNKARFEIYDSSGLTLIGTIDSPYITGGGAATAEYSSTLALGSYKVRAQTIEQAGQISGWTAMVDFSVLQAVNKDLNALWNVADPTVPVPKDLNALWNVVENKAVQLGLLWTVYERSIKDIAITWHVATAWGKITENDTIWTRVTE